MKKLFGLGTVMAAGAGLMYWLLAVDTVKDWKPEPFVCSKLTVGENFAVSHCETKTLDCAVTMHGLSCEDK